MITLNRAVPIIFLLLFLQQTLNAQQVVLTLEAENGELTLPAKVKYVNGYSGNAYVGDNDSGSAIAFNNVQITEAGTYEFKTYYTSMQLRSIAIKINNNSETISSIVNTTADWNTPPTATMSAYIYLNQGANSIKITPYPQGEGGPNMDKFEILTTNVELPKPGEFPIILEAEHARLFGDLKVKPTDGSTIAGLSGGKYIGDFNLSSNPYLQFTDVEIPQEGTYELKVFSMGSDRALSIKVNQYEKSVITTASSPYWDNAPTATVSTLIYMDKGKNKLTFSPHNDNGPNLDKFEIHKTSQTIPKPNIIKLSFISDHTDEAEITAQHPNETLPFLTDNNEFTLYKVTGVTSTQITAKCKYPILLTAYLFYAGMGSSVDLTQWVLESSKDGNLWTVVTPNKSTDLSGAHLFEINRSYGTASTNRAQYYRLTAKGTPNVEVAEWQLFGVPYIDNTDGKSFPQDITEGIDIQSKASGYPEGASGSGWSEKFHNLFNRELNKKYYMSGSKQYYVEIELDKTYQIHSYTLTSADAYPDRDPKQWTFNGYNDELGWVELDRQTDFIFPSRYATMKFNINNSSGFTKFMLDVENNNGSPDSQLLKWQLFGEEQIGGGGGNPVNIHNADDLLKNMTVREKLIYIGGVDWMYTKSIPRLGITSAKMSDGPQGLGTWGASTAYPCALMLASTWNRELAYEYGKALASDCKARGVHILLGPAVNIYRAPMCGRNFEYMGEDPYLAAQTSTEYIKGLQDNGVMGVIKHFAANFQEYDRNYVSSDIDERTLHEIYFPAFKSAVQKAETGAIMTSYNLLNGVWTTENPWLLKDVLRNQWGFNGMVMSDWGSTHNCIPAVTSGLDLEMAGNEIQNEDALRKYLDSGEISMNDIDLKVKHILSTLIKFGVFDGPQLDTNIPLNNPVTVKTALDVSKDGIVLLKNDNNILPLKPQTTKNIVVVGNNALIMAAGGGSGLVAPFSYVSYFDGLKKLGGEKGFDVKYLDKYDHLEEVLFTSSALSEKGLTGRYFNNTNVSGTPVATRVDKRIGFEWTMGTGVAGVNKNDFSVRWEGVLRPTETATYTFRVSGDDGFRLYINNMTTPVINAFVAGSLRERTYSMALTAGTQYSIRLDYFQGGGAGSIDFSWEKSGDTNRFKNELNKADVVVAFIGHNTASEGEASDRTFKLPSNSESLIKEVLSSSTKPVIAVVNAGGNVYMQDWLSTKGLIWGWYGGQEAGTAMAEVLLGDLNPSGKLPITFEKEWNDNPVRNSYYDTNKRVKFTEGVFVGYRGYDKLNRTVQYPFGYGLSYTTFSLSNMQTVNLSDNDNLLEVSFKIKNTGSMAGAEVVQLYVNKQGGSPVERPLRELKDYRKIYLQPGEEKTVSMTLSKEAFSYYSVEKKDFVVDTGNYKIELGTSSRDIKLSANVTINNVMTLVPAVSSEKKNNHLIPSIAKVGDKIKIGIGLADKLMIYDLSGQMVGDYVNTEQIETKKLKAGVYLVHYSVDKIFYTEKFILH